MAYPSSRQLVLNLANTDNPPPDWIESPTFDDVEFDPVVILPDGHWSGREVGVVIKSKPGGRFYNDREVFYNRFDLTTWFGDNDKLPYLNNPTPQNVIDAINSIYGLSFEVDEFTFPELENGTYDGTEITLTATEGNYAYVNAKTFAMTMGLIPLETIIVNQVLNGLVYPEAVVLPPSIDYNIPVSGTLLTEEGDLLSGTNVPINDFVVAYNDEIQVVASAGLWNVFETFPTVDGLKTIQLPDGESDWNFLFGVGTRGVLLGERVVDHYDVELSVTNVSTAESLMLVLVDSAINEGNIDWRIVFDGQAHPNGNDITDNDHTDSWDGIFNIQRLSFYRAAVLPQTDYLPDPPQAAYGTFLIEMRATRKNSVTQVVELSFLVDVLPPV